MWHVLLAVDSVSRAHPGLFFICKLTQIGRSIISRRAIIKCQKWYKTHTFYLPAMHHEINDSRAKWVDKLTDKSPTIKCKIIHWKSWKSGKADKGGRILATTSLKVQNLPRRRHFLTQSTKVDEQNSLISWKITSRHDFEEFPNRESEMEEEKHGGLDPESGLGGSKV